MDKPCCIKSTFVCVPSRGQPLPRHALLNYTEGQPASQSLMHNEHLTEEVQRRSDQRALSCPGRERRFHAYLAHRYPLMHIEQA